MLLSLVAGDGRPPAEISLHRPWIFDQITGMGASAPGTTPAYLRFDQVSDTVAREGEHRTAGALGRSLEAARSGTWADR
jgi:hypothetical protein